MPDQLHCCPICWSRFTPNGRQIYCTDRCRKTAYQRRQRHTADTSTVTRDAAAAAPVDQRACPHCGNTITVITLITTPQAARPRPQPVPETPARATLITGPALPATTLPEQQIRRERLDMPDAIELAETLTFLRRWINSREHELLTQSLTRFIGVDGQHLPDLQADLARFAFLLADIIDDGDGDGDDGGDDDDDGDGDGEQLFTDEPPALITARPCDPPTPDTGALRYAPLEL
ncbi:MAG: hypothetical protein ACRDTV_13790 [Mycobacterium sp.]